jgi:hypothetical protein
MTDSVFTQETPVQQPVVAPVATPTAPAVDHNALFADQLASITSPEGTQKYSTVEDALKGAGHAQTYILQLQDELAQARDSASKATAMTDVMEALKQTNTVTETPTVTGLGEEDASKLFQKMFSDQKVQASNQANELEVSKSLIEQYGDKAKEIITSKATELGVSADYFKELARTSPAAAKQLLGLTTKTPTALSTSTQLNTQALQQGATQETTRAFTMIGHGSNDLLNEWRRCKS